jgi:hypothetical protein
MLKKKYVPSVKSNQELKERVVGAVNGFLYRVEHGTLAFRMDRDVQAGILGKLQSSAELLNHTVGTGEEDVAALADRVLAGLRDLSEAFEQGWSHRALDVADEVECDLELWREILNGAAVSAAEADGLPEGAFACGALTDELAELGAIKARFTANACRLERAIRACENDLAELSASEGNGDSARTANERSKRITALRNRLDVLTVRKESYTTCFHLLDLVCVHAEEIVRAGVLSGQKPEMAGVLPALGGLKNLLSEPDEAIAILRGMQADLQAVCERTQSVDAELAALSTDRTRGID